MLGAAIVALGFAGRAFLPDFNEGSLTISAVTVEQILMAQPEVTAAASCRWRPSSASLPGSALQRVTAS